MDFTIIKHAVEVDHGIKRFSMQFIKQTAQPGRARLSAELCEKITKGLASLGLITLPRRLPTSETDFVFVIQKDSSLGQAVSIATSIAQLEHMGTNPLSALVANYDSLDDYLI